MYYFNPNTYGKQAFVMADSTEKAKEYLLKYRKFPGTTGLDEETEKIVIELHNEILDNMSNLKDGYTLEEFGVGEVKFAEIS